ncbi:MAG: hypothetical protein A3D99_00975 [Candidatus Andersenbacteria bacterium RIFCSPHIGHO2_12_FULL_45_11]|uniref:Uncharacterized protein n=1 Tax=Candidatus Andersenbacteria bacterium RIFCSPHIGHO2_12_FULL_45_11 TaxID=1797281 RepID=A0A1G1X5D7_9BACT|nr:MAG: hypothetical protein A3D99_00975 [Candidatus Andersenbacteria bacterium RIFCSPHIGHO2_12_FULL_45_11]
MATYQYLQLEQHYIDIYDSGTIDYCRRFEKGFQAKVDKLLPKKRPTTTKKSQEHPGGVVAVALYFYSGERAVKKEETIQKWMQEDQARDEKLATAEPPNNILCSSCGKAMTCETKDLYHAYEFPLRVLFLFRCQPCNKGRGVFDDGKEWKMPKKVCPKCSAVLQEKNSRNNKAIITLYTCLNCPYKEKEVFTLSSPPQKEEPEDPYFERDRARFCFTKEQTSHYADFTIKLENVTKMFGESKKLDKHKDVYDAADQLQKLTIDQLEKTLITVMTKNGYIKLELGKPEIDKYVIIPFTVRDAKPDREHRSSEIDLRRLLRTTLEPTSWRLVHDGVSYRLGILSGSLKGYEQEEDLVRLVEQRKTPRP